MEGEDQHEDSGELMGLIPRTLEYLFARIHAESLSSPTTVYTVKCSYIEIYNETIYDLLDPSGATCGLREDTKRGGVFVEGCRVCRVDGPQAAYDLFAEGARNRHVAATGMNRESSRSHSVFTLHIQSQQQRGADGSSSLEDELATVRESRFNLVDLAGSERQQLTGTVGLRLKEAGNINKSLLALSNVINALVETAAGGRPRHVHYRDSRLTFLLRDSLGGNAKTCIVACVGPAAAAAGETLSTLRFAQRAKMIRNKAIVNEAMRGGVPQLQAEIRRLQLELAKQKIRLPVYDISDDVPMCPVDGDGPSAVLLKGAMQRQVELGKELQHTRTQLEALEELSRRKDCQIQSERLLRKLREAALSQRNNPSSDSDDTVRLLEEEVQILQEMLQHHPDVVRFALDNTRLRERLGQVEEALGQADFEGIQAQLHRQQAHIDTLTSRLVAAEDCQMDGEMEGKRRRLSVDDGRVEQLEERIGYMSAEVLALKAQLEDEVVREEALRLKSQQLSNHIEQLVTEKGHLQSSLQSYQLEMDSRVNLLSTERDSLRAAFSEQTTLLSQAQLRLFHLAQEKTDLENHLTTTEATWQDRHAQLQSHQDHLTRLHAAKLQAAEEMSRSAYEELQKRADAEAGRMREVISRLEAGLAETQTHVDALTGQLDALREKYARLAEQLAESQQKDRQDLSQSQAQSEEVQALRLELSYLRQSSAGIQSRLSLSEADREAARAKADALDLVVGELRTRMAPAPPASTVDETRYKVVQAENVQLHQKINKLEQILRHASEVTPSPPKPRSTPTPVTSTAEYQQLQAAYSALLAERTGLQEDNAKLIAHHNAKQKLHYHVKIKEENNRLREEVAALQGQLARMMERGNSAAKDVEQIDIT